MKRLISFFLLLFALGIAMPASAQYVRLKDIGRFDGWRDNPLVGYGVVTGLAGSGDSARNEVTRQALKNILGRMGLVVTPEQIQSRNVAVVMVTATLPPSANVGDRIDVTVTSIGDARSLSGGSLLMTTLVGPDQRPYALAQGALVVGGYRFEADQNLKQKNFPTTGIVASGATVERAVDASIDRGTGVLTFILSNPDFTTATKVADTLNAQFGATFSGVRSADAVQIRTSGWEGSVNALIARVENIMVEPDAVARIVINERTGTIVAGGNIQISDIVIVQGDLKVSVQIDNSASQQNIYGGFVRDPRGVVVTNTTLDVTEGRDAVMRFSGSTVGDLVQGLTRARVPTRTIIAILQAIKSAGALHAEILVQ
jgi:flagellar P-ring protein FlgI